MVTDVPKSGTGMQNAGAGIGVLAGLMSAFGSYQSGKAAESALEYNAYVAQQDAQLIEKAGEQELYKAQTRRRMILAEQVAIAAASGRSISGGSPLAIIEASERAGLLDEKIIAHNTITGAGNKRAGAALLYGQGQQEAYAGKAASYSALLSSAQSATKFKIKKGGKKAASTTPAKSKHPKHPPVIMGKRQPGTRKTQSPVYGGGINVGGGYTAGR